MICNGAQLRVIQPVNHPLEVGQSPSRFGSWGLTSGRARNGWMKTAKEKRVEEMRLAGGKPGKPGRADVPSRDCIARDESVTVQLAGSFFFAVAGCHFPLAAPQAWITTTNFLPFPSTIFNTT